MTGFGRAQRSAGTLRVQVEIRSVNHRHAEVRLKLPAALGALEDELRARLSAAVRRGRAEATVVVVGHESDAPVEINHALIRGYIRAAGEVGRRHGLKGAVTLESVLALPGAVTVRPGESDLTPRQRQAVQRAFDDAVKQLERSRLREGRHLSGDLARRLRAVEKHRTAVLSGARGAPGRWARRLRERLKEIDQVTKVDPARLAQEVAFMASRSDITEELVRLEAHLEQAGKLLKEPSEPVGRKLDFLLQEMHREANTINSKSEDIRISRHALAIKAELEKLREQAQNIE